MNSFILFLHYFGLMLGGAGGFGSLIVMRRALALPADQAQTLRTLGPVLAHVSGVGLVVLWITGIILVFGHGGAGAMPSLFWVKLFFVVVLTGMNGFVHMTYAQIRRTKNPALGQRLMVLGPASGATTLLIVLIAAYAFG